MGLSYSAVIIAHNEEECIQKTVESILNQSVKPYRIVVVDDGSTDATPQILSRLPVHIRRIQRHNKGDDVYANTLSQVRNAGLACIHDDPVDWIYQGDADTVLPPKYCETIMRYSDENGACIGCGSLPDVRIELPYEGFMMMRHDWLKSVGMETKWESIYLCVKALSTGNSILVRHADDCIVDVRRPYDERWNAKRIIPQRAKLIRRMGLSWYLFLCMCAWYACHGRIGYACRFCKGGLLQKRKVPEEMARAYGEYFVQATLQKRIKRLNRQHRLFTKHNMNTICRLPSAQK